MLDLRLLTSATEGLLATAAIGASWEDDLDAMARAAGSHSAALWRTRRGIPSFVGNAAFSEGVTKLNRPGDPPYTDDVLRVASYGAGFVSSARGDVSRRLGQIPFYSEVMVPAAFTQYAGLDLGSGDDGLLRFWFWRGGKEGGFDEAELRALDTVAANVRFATLFAQRNAELLARGQAASYLERRRPCFLLDLFGRATPMNESADRASSAGAVRLRNGRLEAPTDTETRRLGRIVGEAVGARRSTGSTVVLAPGGERFQVLVMPLLGRSLDVFSAHVAIAVVVRLDDHGSLANPTKAGRFLATGFGMTDREVTVALLGADGMAPRAIAARLRIGEGTVRNHLKAALRKADLHSQVELGALIARYV